MNKKKIGVALIGAALLLSGCGSGVPAVSADSSDTIREQVFQYDGKPLHCVSMYSDSNAGVLDCDFVRYHNENG